MKCCCPLLICLVVSLLFTLSGCQGLAGGPQKPESVQLSTAEPTIAETIEPEKPAPEITFDSVEYDFGTIGPGVKKVGEFKFTNTGDGLLKITEVKKCCGVVTRLGKTEYAPGESGVLKVEYRSNRLPAKVRKLLYVSSNDESKPRVALTIRAKIALKVDWEPKSFKLSFRDEELICPPITIKSLDGRPFSITGFTSTGGGITAETDGSAQAPSFVLTPVANVEKLRKYPKGSITIGVSYPEPNTPSEMAVIRFEALSRFSFRPPVLVVVYNDPQEPIKKSLQLVGNYGEDFDIESVLSQKGHIKVLGQRKVRNGYHFSLEITPGPAENAVKFTDTLSVKIKGGETLKLSCRGIYSKRKIKPKESTQR